MDLKAKSLKKRLVQGYTVTLLPLRVELAPIIFAFLLGSCVFPRIRLGRLISIAFITALSFAILFAPLLLGSLYDFYRNIPMQDQLLPPIFTDLGIKVESKSFIGVIIIQISQSIHRIFPFARGLFEDKVANFWCFLNTFYKVRNLQSLIQLPRLSLLITLMSILPSMIVIGLVPRKSLLPYALASSAWGFFLFSFQVHEKSILLPLLPMTLLLGSKQGLSKEYRAWIGWANLLGMWTMYPLLKRDELTVPYVVVSILWAYLMGLPPTSVSAYYDPENENVPGKPLSPDDLWTPTKILHFQYYVVMAFWHLLAAFAPPPEGKPDLWIVANACIGAVGFGICYLWCTWKLFYESGLLDSFFDTDTVDEEDSKGKPYSLKEKKDR